MAGDGSETDGVALQQGEAAPVLQSMEQLGEVQLLPGAGQRLAVGGLESRAILGQQRIPDGRRGGTGQQRVAGAGLLVEGPRRGHRATIARAARSGVPVRWWKVVSCREYSTPPRTK